MGVDSGRLFVRLSLVKRLAGVLFVEAVGRSDDGKTRVLVGEKRRYVGSDILEGQRTSSAVFEGRLEVLGSDRLHRQHPSAPLWQFGPSLGVAVEEGEVRDDDWHRQSNGENSSEGTDRPHKHAKVRLRCHVSIPHGGHGDDGPPQTLGNRGEVVFFVYLSPLGVVDQRGKHDDEENEEEDEKGEFVGGCLEGVDEDLETRRVPGKLEKTHDAHDAQEVQYLVLLLEEHHN